MGKRIKVASVTAGPMTGTRREIAKMSFKAPPPEPTAKVWEEHVVDGKPGGCFGGMQIKEKSPVPRGHISTFTSKSR